ncbi:MAG: glycosyltransferase family 2 protein [Candidatus Omnitrophica bacterium]|nr:glycosyltransferase family 2 protein [Candidatus Omnitrophota bacterium]
MKSAELDLSVVIPAYNEEPNLASTLKDIAGWFEAKDLTYEVIVVDDGSDDKTAEVASSLNHLFSSFALLKNESNRGKGYTVKKGVIAAKGRYLLFMDADNSTRIDQIDKFMRALEEGNDIALASRRIEGSEITKLQPLRRRVLGNLYIMLSKIILGTSVRDYNCGFKLYKKDVAKLLFSKLTKDNWSFDSELIYLAHKFSFKSKEVPVRWEDKAKTSKVRPLRDGINSLLSLFSIRLNAFKKVYD